MGSGADNIEEFMGEEQACISNLETITIPIVHYKKMLIVAEKYRELVNEHARENQHPLLCEIEAVESNDSAE